MKPEKILESNLLDIVFENRNKDYGAYELRKNYNNRAVKALGITTLVVVAFGLMQSFKVPHKTGRILLEGPTVNLADAPKQKIEEKKKEEVKQKQSQPKEVAQQLFTKPEIAEQVKTPVATIDQLKDAVISNITLEGPKIGPKDVEPLVPKSIGTGTTGDTKPVEVSDGPREKAEFMPQFPGGNAAFIKFMQKHLRQPDDFEEGQRMTIIARFVVDAEGNIVDIDITQNGRNDLDAEVIRVIKKMPAWVPGMQNGRKVAVYFKVPVTFVAPE